MLTNRKANKPTIAVAMSGGVDSSLAAALLVQQGFRVVGLTMRLFCHEEADRDRSCCSLDSIESARQAADRLGIPHYVVDCRRVFRGKVIDYFVSEYRNGRTPNPCVECNRHLKFGFLLDKARSLGCECLATGHYARIVVRKGRPALARGADESKDQSYFLWPLTRARLKHVLFPLGGMTKRQVRDQASRLGLAAASRPESQEICFINGPYADFLRGRFAPVPGDVVDPEGRVLGRHKGIVHYTVGQREGLGIAIGRPQYVLGIDAGKNRITVGDGPLLRSAGCLVGEVNWILPRPRRAARCLVRLRHRHPGAPASVKALSGYRAEIIFDQPQRAVTPGQSAVLYRGGLVLGGGVIGPPRKNPVAS